MNARDPEMNDRSRVSRSDDSSSLEAGFGPEEYSVVELRLHEINSSCIECDFAEEEGAEVPISSAQPTPVHDFRLKSPPPFWKNIQSEVKLLYPKERSGIPNG